MKNEYKPKRAGKKWRDADCPAEVLDIFDEGEKSPYADRYTVFYATPNGRIDEPLTFANASIVYIGMSENPFHPQGVGMHGEMSAYDCVQYRYRNGHKRVKWSTLPDKVRKCVAQNCEPEAA